MKWEVSIPRPSAARMAGTGRLFVQLSDGWLTHQPEQIFLTPEHTTVQFDVDDDYEWIGATTMMDGPSFDVWIEYNNSTGSRQQKIRLVPGKVK